ncbi:unnamed protein product [Dovyalis caffra]|uniref:Uncharacterized protein n=1 Tax=Dovyalis caffra TaxID=77055 RepID=A0AAV1QZU4_9ROSI|nr:unnamed protein product [Dovyalis caffra]
MEKKEEANVESMIVLSDKAQNNWQATHDSVNWHIQFLSIRERRKTNRGSPMTYKTVQWFISKEINTPLE